MPIKEISWQTHSTPFMAKTVNSGIYPIAMKDEVKGIAAGTNGMNISFNGWKVWQALIPAGMHAICFAPSEKTGWASGANGQIIKVVIP